jgi:hypothetical protein
MASRRTPQWQPTESVAHAIKSAPSRSNEYDSPEYKLFVRWLRQQGAMPWSRAATRLSSRLRPRRINWQHTARLPSRPTFIHRAGFEPATKACRHERTDKRLSKYSRLAHENMACSLGGHLRQSCSQASPHPGSHSRA